MIKNQIFLIFQFLLISANNISKDPEVWITLSSFSETGETRLIELNWRNHLIEFNNLVSLALTDKEPILNNNGTTENYLYTYSNLKSTEGLIRSHIRMPIINLDLDEFVKHQKCLFNIWVVYLIEYVPKSKNCLKTNPTWFENIFEYVKNKNLKEIVIAGTHDSGSFQLPLFSLAGLLYRKYVLTQEEPIFNQLIYGIRFFDLRVSYEHVFFRQETYWIVHGSIRMHLSVEEVLKQVLKFVQLTKKEIIILDFHKFEKGFKYVNKEKKKIRHQGLSDLIVKYLHGYLAFNLDPYNENIESLIRKNHRIIIGYYNDVDFNLQLTKHFSPNLFTTITGNLRYSFLHQQVTHYWPNVDNLLDLEIYLNETYSTCMPVQLNYKKNHSFLFYQNQYKQDEQIAIGLLDALYDNLEVEQPYQAQIHTYQNQNKTNYFKIHSVMAQFTPKLHTILFKKYPEGLRKMAQIVNHKLDSWILNRYFNCVNIISTDFFLSNNVIELAARINQIRYNY